MGKVIREINGVKCCLAHSHEKGAFEHEGEFWRPLVVCDKCDGPNDRADESNYCSQCAAAYQARVRQDPETRPVGTK